MPHRFRARSEDGLEFFSVLGVGISATTLSDSCDRILRWVAERHRTYVTVTSMHGIMEARKSPALRRIFGEAGLVTPDGMPLVYIGRSRGFHLDRTYGPDLMMKVLQETRHGEVGHFLYGGDEGVADLLSERIRARYPGIRIEGTYCPPFRPLTEIEKADVARTINQSGAEIVWVGISTPKQEHWMAEMRPLLNAPVLIGVGAAFDFHTGLKKMAPRWMQRAALEWLFRLCSEPRRLWRRYLFGVPRFLVLVVLESVGFLRRPPFQG